MLSQAVLASLLPPSPEQERSCTSDQCQAHARAWGSRVSHPLQVDSAELGVVRMSARSYPMLHKQIPTVPLIAQQTKMQQGVYGCTTDVNIAFARPLVPHQVDLTELAESLSLRWTAVLIGTPWYTLSTWPRHLLPALLTAARCRIHQ